MKLLTYLTTKPVVNWFRTIDNDDTFITNEELLEQAIALEYYWRINTTPPTYIDVTIFGIPPQNSFQYKAVINGVYCALQGKSTLVLAGTGTGKTYINFSILDILAYYDYFAQCEARDNTVYPFKSVYFTPSNVVEQTNEVKKLYKNITNFCVVINYETLRTKRGLGNIFIEWKAESVKGDIVLTPSWIKETSPCFIVCDECQKLKNNGAMQTRLIQAYLNLRLVFPIRRILVLHASATPFTRPIESKTTVLSLSPLLELTNDSNKRKKKIWVKNEKESTSNKIIHDALEVFIKENDLSRVKQNNYDYFLKEVICGSRITPEEYSPAAMERLTKYLSSEDQLIHVSEVKFKHKTKNKHILIDFYDENERVVYNKAYEEYVNELLKHNKSEPGGMAAIFVAMLKFRKMAELLRARHLARLAFEQYKINGKAVIVATSFIETQEAIHGYLVNEHKMGGDNISVIRGGQPRATRWNNVNKFQDDKSGIMLLMMQAGGVGLSLHHHKPRNKKPRFVLMPPVWSIIEMLQVLGRAHRINSESTTTQWVVWYKGTIEESVCEKLQKKSLSMRELMRSKEQWSELFVNESLKEIVDLKEVFEKGANNTIITDDESDNDVNETSDNEKDGFNLDEEAIADNMEQEVIEI